MCVWVGVRACVRVVLVLGHIRLFYQHLVFCQRQRRSMRARARVRACACAYVLAGESAMDGCVRACVRPCVRARERARVRVCVDASV